MEKAPVPKKPKVRYQDALWEVVGHSILNPNDEPMLTIRKIPDNNVLEITLDECTLLDDIVIQKTE